MSWVLANLLPETCSPDSLSDETVRTVFSISDEHLPRDRPNFADILNTHREPYSETDALTNGATDIGSVYIALGDWDAPVRITTKDKNLFDKNDEKIIAYGEWDLTTQTQGEDGGLLEFEIPIDYRSLTRIPSYIVIVASASKYGDYFTGSTGSTMWLDDLELIYE